MTTFYSRIQFVKAVVFTKSPYTPIVDAEQPEYAMRDDGPAHVLVTKGAASVRVPWSNIAASVPVPGVVPALQIVPKPAVVVPALQIVPKPAVVVQQMPQQQGKGGRR